LDRRRGPETELLCPGEPTPITLSVSLEFPSSAGLSEISISRKSCDCWSSVFFYPWVGLESQLGDVI